MDVCTIIAKNHVAQARVLARSFAAQHLEVTAQSGRIDLPRATIPR